VLTLTLISRGDETDLRAIQNYRTVVASPARQRNAYQFKHVERDFVLLSIWEYDREMYKKRNEIERLFRRLKGFRRIFTRFEKPDVVFRFFINFALIVGKLISVNTP